MHRSILLTLLISCLFISACDDQKLNAQNNTISTTTTSNVQDAAANITANAQKNTDNIATSSNKETKNHQQESTTAAASQTTSAKDESNDSPKTTSEQQSKDCKLTMKDKGGVDEKVDGVTMGLSIGGSMGSDIDLPGVPPQADEFGTNNGCSVQNQSLQSSTSESSSSKISPDENKSANSHSQNTIEDTKTLPNIDNVQEILVGISPDYPPFESLSNGSLQGFDVDLITAVGNKMNKSIKFVQMPFYSLIPALDSGKIDLIISSMSATKNRMQIVDFSQPYYSAKLAVVFMSNSPENRQSIFKGARIGVQTGSTMDLWLRSLPEEHIIRVVRDSTIQLVEELRSENIDLIVLEKAQAISIAAAPSKDMEFSVIENAPAVQSYSIAGKKNSPLIPHINIAISQITQDQTLNNLEQKWQLSE